MCIHTTCVLGTLGCQKWALALLVLELQMVVVCQLVLQTEPGSSGEQPVLLTAEPSPSAQIQSAFVLVPG